MARKGNNSGSKTDSNNSANAQPVQQQPTAQQQQPTAQQQPVAAPRRSFSLDDVAALTATQSALEIKRIAQSPQSSLDADWNANSETIDIAGISIQLAVGREELKGGESWRKPIPQSLQIGGETFALPGRLVIRFRGANETRYTSPTTLQKIADSIEDFFPTNHPRRLIVAAVTMFLRSGGGATLRPLDYVSKTRTFGRNKTANLAEIE